MQRLRTQSQAGLEEMTISFELPCIEAPAVMGIVSLALLFADEPVLATAAMLTALCLAIIYRIQVSEYLKENSRGDL